MPHDALHRHAAARLTAGAVPLTHAPEAAALRVSVTDRCNLRCAYCMPASGVALVPRDELPSLEELAGAVAWLVATHGVDRVKVTGGEPLVRDGVPGFVARVAAIPGVAEVSMTTNGTRLSELADELARAGLARVNVSLDTLDPARFAALTRGGRVEEVLGGIAAARRAGLVPVKLNSVLRRSAYRDDVPALLDLAAGEGIEIRFIELMQTGTEAAWALAERVEGAEVRAWLQESVRVHRLPGPASAPARRTLVHWKGRDVAVGWIDPVSHSFCDACDRLRLDARGRLRRCLMDDAAFPLAELLLRGEASVEEAARLFVAGKRPPGAMATGQTMASIGG